MKKFFVVLVCTVLFAFQSPVTAVSSEYDGATHPQHHTTGWVRGEVIKIDKPRKHIIIKHDAIDSIGMAAMTMPFKARSIALLNKVKVGDQVKFELQVGSDELSLVRIEVVK